MLEMVLFRLLNPLLDLPHGEALRFLYPSPDMSKTAKPAVDEGSFESSGVLRIEEAVGRLCCGDSFEQPVRSIVASDAVRVCLAMLKNEAFMLKKSC
jgi:hypothetical protein